MRHLVATQCSKQYVFFFSLLEESLAYHQQALVLKPMASSTYAAIGYVQTLMQKYFEVMYKLRQKS